MKKNNPLWTIRYGLGIAAILLLTCAPALHYSHHRFFRMTSLVDITITSNKSDTETKSLWNSIDSMLALWEERYCQTNARSEVRKINTRTSQACPVSKQLGNMVTDALAFGDTTGGLFDPTIFPIKELWGLVEGDTVHHVPDTVALKQALEHVNYHTVRTNPAHDTVFFSDPAATIDAGGFAKGYVLIEAAKILDNYGFENYLIAAGDVVARGRRIDGKPWNIGIRHPRKNSLIATIPVNTGAIFTSGDYESFWMDGNRRIHHIFNPKTGFSCTNNQSVTIGSHSIIQAKYLSTGLFCMSADSIVMFSESRGLNCFVVDSTGTVHISSGWKEKLQIVE